MLRRWHHFWFEPSPPANLAVSRALFFLGLFAWYLPEDFSRWGSVEPAFWMPTAFFAAFHVPLLPAGVLEPLQVVWRTALVTSAAGLFTRTSMTVAFVLGFYLLGLPHNFGHVYHFDALLVIVLAILACSRAGDAWSIDARRSRRDPEPSGEYTWPIRLIWVMTAFVFFGAGISKLRRGGLAWIASPTMSIILMRAAYHVSDADPITSAGLWIARHESLSRVLAAFALAIELGFASSLFSTAARAVFVPAAALMLVGIRVLMGPTFGGFLIANVFWVPWQSLLQRLSPALLDSSAPSSLTRQPPRAAAPR